MTTGTAHTKYGSIKYMDIGPSNGKVILFSTGGGASFESALAFKWICEEGYRVISINRPGYFDLPTDIVGSIEEHADIYHEVLQSLEIEYPVNVFGVSMGGLSALYFSAKYPTKSLVLWSAVTGNYQVNEASVNSTLGKLILKKSGKKLISWILRTSATLFPQMTIQSFLKAEANLNRRERKNIAKEMVHDTQSMEEFKVFIRSMLPMDLLFDGMMDEVNKAQHLEPVDWSAIKCPVYVVHSVVDKDVGLEHPNRLEKMIPDITTEYVKAGGHFVWWGNEGKAVKEHTIQFLSGINDLHH